MTNNESELYFLELLKEYKDKFEAPPLYLSIKKEVVTKVAELYSEAVLTDAIYTQLVMLEQLSRLEYLRALRKEQFKSAFEEWQLSQKKK